MCKSPRGSLLFFFFAVEEAHRGWRGETRFYPEECGEGVWNWSLKGFPPRTTTITRGCLARGSTTRVHHFKANKPCPIFIAGVLGYHLSNGRVTSTVRSTLIVTWWLLSSRVKRGVDIFRCPACLGSV